MFVPFLTAFMGREGVDRVLAGSVGLCSIYKLCVYIYICIQIYGFPLRALQGFYEGLWKGSAVWV